MKIRLRIAFVLFWVSAYGACSQPAWSESGPVATYNIQAGGASLQIDFSAGELDLPQNEFVGRIQTAAVALAGYYGRFPVPRARVLIIPVPAQAGVLQGTSWGNARGWPGFTRLRIGQHTTHEDLATDWVITHELVHMAFTSLPDKEHWLEEGIATYIEPIARAQAGELELGRVWTDMISGMPQGEPAANDRGMDHTHTWGRTYWGGALFCLVADVEIRKETDNRKGLQDALRQIVAAGATIDTERPLDQVLRDADRATGTHVLARMFAEWSEKPVTVDLDHLWSQLGIQRHAGGVTFNPVAPLSRIRVMLTAPHDTAVLPSNLP